MNVNIPTSCSDEQFSKILETLKSTNVLTENQKAYYTDLLQKQFAQIIIQKAVIDAMKPKSMDSDSDDLIIIREKRKRAEE